MRENKRFTFREDIVMIPLLAPYRDNHDKYKDLTVEDCLDLLNYLYDEKCRLECINKQLEERLDRSLALDMGACE